MTNTAEMADFIGSIEYEDLPEESVDEIKKRLLDTLGIAIGAIGHEPVEIVRETVGELDSDGTCTVWGHGTTASPPEATMVNTAHTRYLDFMDSFLLPGEAPHPTDNVGAAVATGEYADVTGEELIAGIGIAYEIHGGLAEVAPGRDKGWDHIQVVFSSTAVAAKLLGLDREEIRNAIGIAGASYNPLRVTRTGQITMWKGIASANMARNGVYSSMLAANGMEGPRDVFEGQKGWKEIVMREDFDLEYTNCRRVTNIMTKKYVAGTHAQTAIEGVLEMREEHGFNAEDVEHVDIDTYRSAKHVMGGGEGDRHEIRNREQADHSIPYTVAVALLDGEVTNEQYQQERILRDDVQEMMRRIDVAEDPDLTERYDEEGDQPFRLTVTTTDGETYQREKFSFEGHPNDPMSWDRLTEKFDSLATPHYSAERREEIVDVVRNMDNHSVDELVALLD